MQDTCLGYIIGGVGDLHRWKHIPPFLKTISSTWKLDISINKFDF